MSEKKEPKTKRTSGIVGWGAARKITDRCNNDARRELIAGLVCQAGVRGAPAMEYVARLIRWHIDEADAPAAGKGLSQIEIAYCEKRVKELLRPFVDGADHRLPKNIRAMREAA